MSKEQLQHRRFICYNTTAMQIEIDTGSVQTPKITNVKSVG